MSTIYSKYILDENGEIFSPVVSSDSIINGKNKIIFENDLYYKSGDTFEMKTIGSGAAYITPRFNNFWS